MENSVKPPVNELRGSLIQILCSQEFEPARIQDKATILEIFIKSLLDTNKSLSNLLSGRKLENLRTLLRGIRRDKFTISEAADHINEQVDNLKLDEFFVECNFDIVEDGGLTHGRKYKLLARNGNHYCVVNDHNKLVVYGSGFFKEKIEKTKY